MVISTWLNLQFKGKKFIQKIKERKYEKYSEKQRKHMKNYRPKEKSKI